MALFIKVTDVSGQSILVNLDRVNCIYKDTQSTYGGNYLDNGVGPPIYVKEDFVSNPELLTKNIVFGQSVGSINDRLLTVIEIL